MNSYYIFIADYPVQKGLDPCHQLTESDIHESQLAEQIGLKWKDLARELGFLQSTIDMIEKEKLYCNKECCIDQSFLYGGGVRTEQKLQLEN